MGTQLGDVWTRSIQWMCRVFLGHATPLDTAGQGESASVGMGECLDIMSVINTKHTCPNPAELEFASFELENQRLVHSAKRALPNWRSANLVRPGGTM